MMNATDATSTTGRINRISQENAYKICSGQAVVDLTTAVKELLENAMDAQATVVEIRLKEFGKDRIEVIDNGSGIVREDYGNVVRKHFTSKISEFDDLDRVLTFGFRGEALSALCQLAGKLSIVTRTESDPVGSMLEFDATGTLTKQTPKARPVGTTVIVENLFQPLPVRVKDFHKNIKKHYTKLLRHLQAYALIGTNVKLSCVNVPRKGPSQRILSTQLNGTLLEKISNIFGTKFSKTLLPVDILLSGDENRDSDSDGLAKVQGFVSKAGDGVGRSDSDRQFFYVNGRPVNLAKFMRGLNEVWRTFEMKHKPACVLNFILPSGIVDVNVTPDKRETFIVNQQEYLDRFKSGMDALWQPSRGKFTVSQQQPLSFGSVSSCPTTSAAEQPSVAETTRTAASGETRETEHVVVVDLGSSGMTEEEEKTPVAPPPSSNPRFISSPAVDEDRRVLEADAMQSLPGQSSSQDDGVQEPPPPPDSTVPGVDNTPHASPSPQPEANVVRVGLIRPRASSQHHQYSNNSNKRVSNRRLSRTPTSERQEEERVEEEDSDQATNGKRQKVCHVEKRKKKSTSYRIASTIDQIRASRRDRDRKRSLSSPCLGLDIPNECSANKTTDIDPDAVAMEFERILSKESFNRMKIIGQFNLGFILASLDNDVFIIDQHASDEKHRFERLQQTTEIHIQPLVSPLPLELTAVEEMIIIDHLSVFEQNGFQFLIDSEAEATKKIRLRAIPFSKSTQFGPTDVHELVSMLSESGKTIHSAAGTTVHDKNCSHGSGGSCVKLPKLMAMFASRACRASVMIGTALKRDEQDRIVRNLATLQQPWNCPHGRPTLRHLVDLSTITKKK